MPRTKVVFYRDENGMCPVLEWLRTIPAKAQDKCRVKMGRLAELGHELRRPEADLLRDKIYELRASLQGVHYRLLYFFHGNTAAVLASGITKEEKVRIKSHETHLLEGIMMKKKKGTTNALEIMDQEFYRGKPQRIADLEKMRADDAVARKIYELRTKAGLTQRQLAGLVGTTASVICRVEDSEYAGHSLAMLNRIAAALHRRVDIRFVPVRGGESGALAYVS